MTQVALTGGTGKLGRACLTELLEHGYSVTNVDLVRPANDPCPFARPPHRHGPDHGGPAPGG